VIEPGLVLLRKFVPDAKCQRIANLAFDLGEEGDSGVYSTGPSGEKILNTGESRGPIYDSISRFPPSLLEKCNLATSTTRQADNEMPAMNCTYLLLNMHTETEGLVWHHDIYENDGKSDHPVVNMCIGASCLFGFEQNDEDPECTIILQSGDVLLFGGPCRLIKHAMLKVVLDDCPSWMPTPCRFSFTFHDSPEVIGHVDEFKYFKVKEHLVGQETFQVPIDRKTFKGLPSQTGQGIDIALLARLNQQPLGPSNMLP